MRTNACVSPKLKTRNVTERPLETEKVENQIPKAIMPSSITVCVIFQPGGCCYLLRPWLQTLCEDQSSSVHQPQILSATCCKEKLKKVACQTFYVRVK